ncbi:hypothetical protein OJ998_08165 [Solirubrobacter taibaiensis]|nr:hypothetical protein [Solirubrobacter taibaiensis]
MFRRLAVPAIAFAFALLGGGTAYAQDRTDVMVEGLKQSPVWVSDSVTRRIDDGDRAALLRAVEAMPFSTYLVVAPFLSAADVVSDEDRLALLRDGLGKDGLYIVSDDRGQIVDATAFGVQLPMRARDITQAAYWDFDRDDPALPKLEYILALARGEPRMPRAERAAIPPSEGGPTPTPYSEPDESDNAALGFGVIGAFLFGAALSGTGLERRRRRRLSRGRRHAGSLPAGDVRTRAVNAHSKLARELARKKAPNERALDLEAAASMALDRKGKPIDDLGALVLAERGREVLKGSERSRCYFDPRHHGQAKPTRWTTNRATIEVPACTKCARAIAADKVPDSLWDGDRPYWQRETVWARTGIGTLRRDMRGALAEDGR